MIYMNEDEINEDEIDEDLATAIKESKQMADISNFNISIGRSGNSFVYASSSKTVLPNFLLKEFDKTLTQTKENSIQTKYIA